MVRGLYTNKTAVGWATPIHTCPRAHTHTSPLLTALVEKSTGSAPGLLLGVRGSSQENQPVLCLLTCQLKWTLSPQSSSGVCFCFPSWTSCWVSSVVLEVTRLKNALCKEQGSFLFSRVTYRNLTLRDTR